jgi:hypothetical protein
VKAATVKELDGSRSVAYNAARILRTRLAELYGFDPAIRDAAAVTALHDMRIAAKRLRYVLEICGHVFGDHGERMHDAARALQEVIGEIHDCDVIAPRIQNLIDALRADDAAALHRRAGHEPDGLPALLGAAPNAASYRGLELLVVAIAARRSLLYARFRELWDGVLADDLRAEIEAAAADVEDTPVAGEVAAVDDNP